MKDKLQITTSISTIAFGLGILWHFSNIIRYGRFYISEPNNVILAVEVSVIVILVILAVFSLISLYKRAE